MKIPPLNVGNIITPEPHYIPGYTGYCPQYMYRIGNTYSSLSHKLLIDPTVAHAEKLILADRSTDEYQVNRPTIKEIDPTGVIVPRHEDEDMRDTIYRKPLMPGYEGYIPRTQGKYGRRYAVVTSEGLSEFERDCLRNRAQMKKLRHRTAQPISTISEYSLGDRMKFHKRDYHFPLEATRPDAAGVGKEVPFENLPQLPALPYSQHTPPHFMDNTDEEKHFKLGYTGHKPFLWPRFGEANVSLTKKALCDFTNSYQHRRHTEWVPISPAGSGTCQPSAAMNEIYMKNIGLVPSYKGHVPGAMFRFGTTFGNDSKNAKRCLKKCYED
nr:UPF0605 protein GA14893-like isoform X1 [Aedes albopictus]XP_029712397.1 UPF0605 protein GA14893-like isoform X1 [Aedes albopictus]XP_029712398.1 UPF0605 protein GA14893-like isoform X1 [Aedes albopictus]XP_029712399.1 UPF0605 protein GA14893-like isoform X1 [Aedes albopictus]XP_029712400.1 UPF0605 protein GA14893-like isoform X1 [Aedes albopictus]XP_029712401.1 UPF0605 protein GA14893-like isoform X1 [Aedes albopictus]